MSSPFRSNTLTASFDDLGEDFPRGVDDDAYGPGTLNQFWTTSIHRAATQNWRDTAGCDAKADGTIDLQWLPLPDIDGFVFGGAPPASISGSFNINPDWDDSAPLEIADTAPDFTKGLLPLVIYPSTSFQGIDIGSASFQTGTMTGAIVLAFTATVTIEIVPPSYRRFEINAPSDWEIGEDTSYAPTSTIDGKNYFAAWRFKLSYVIDPYPNIISNDTGYPIGPVDGIFAGTINLSVGGVVGIDAEETGWSYGLAPGGRYDSVWYLDHLPGYLTVDYDSPRDTDPTTLAWHTITIMRLDQPDPILAPSTPGLVVDSFAFGPRVRYDARPALT